MASGNRAWHLAIEAEESVGLVEGKVVEGDFLTKLLVEISPIFFTENEKNRSPDSMLGCQMPCSVARCHGMLVSFFYFLTVSTPSCPRIHRID